MTQLPDPPSAAQQREFAVLSALAQELAGEFRLQPLLEKIVTSAVSLVGCSSGSICTIDEAAQRYRKEIDLAVVCQAGGEFSLDEGVTGAVARAGGTVIFADYADVPGGHISTADPRFHRSVIGVPISLQGAIIGALVVFADRDDQVFTDGDRALLDLFATHAAIAIANSRLHTHAADHAKAAAIAAERERMLCDVHDTVGRAVAGVLLHLGEAAERAGRGDDPGLAIAEAKQAAAAALEYGHVMTSNGGPLLDRGDLETRISAELDWVASTARLRTHLLVVGEWRPMSGDAARQLLHIVREALTNVASHAGADSVRAGLVYGPESVTVIIEDDGVGFDTALLRAGETERPRSWGLTGLVSRARQLGGSVLINSTPAWGTRIEASLPYDIGDGDERGPQVRWRLLVAHESAVVRAGIVRLLTECEPEIQVIAEAGETPRALEAAGLLRPGLVLADLDLPGLGGAATELELAPAEFVAAVKAVTNSAGDPGAEVVFFVPSADDPRIRDAVRAGARGFIDPGMDGVSIGRALVSAASGDALVSGQLLDTLGNLGDQASDRLTAREREVHRLVTQGLADKQIAAALKISIKTVEKHVGTILRKTGARNRTMLAAHAGRRD
jgi:DNA-binding NarL/FixJ family response regulator/signal transduction histidine kinase